MATHYKITIPKPCHEDWNQMTPDETGRFCNSCTKSVVDFSNMKAQEIQEYFIKNQRQKVCGRFKTEQLDSIIIQIPRDVLFSQVQFYKMFMLALLISMPGLLIGQNSSGKSQSISKVEVIDSINKKQTTGRVKLDTMVHQDDVMTPERKARIAELQKKRKAIIKLREARKKTDRGMFIAGDIAITTDNTIQSQPKKEFYLTSEIDKSPSFPNGIAEFYEYFNSNFKVPDECKHITTKLFFSFIINPDGSLSDIKLVRGVNEKLNNEAMRVLKSSPKWIAGECKGEKVKVYYSIPIKITAKE